MRYQELAIIAVLLFSISCSEKRPNDRAARPVRVSPAESYSAKKGSRYSATIRPNTQVEISFKVGGYIEKIAAASGSDGIRRILQPGDLVTRGQFLAQLRRGEYQVRVAQANSQKSEVRTLSDTTLAQIAEAESAETIQKSQVSEAETILEQAKIDLNRSRNLFETQSATKKELETATTNFEAARTRVETARASLKTAQAKIKTLRTQIDVNRAKLETADTFVRQAEIPLDDTTLRAPLSGVILERRIEAGALAVPNAPAFILADTTAVKAVFGVPDVELARLQHGQTLVVTTESLPDEEFAGRISRIAPAADPSSRDFEVEVAIPNPQSLLKPGMITSLELNSEQFDAARTVVPMAAVIRSKTAPDRYAVFVIREIDGVRTAHSRDVELGETFGNSIAVTTGLQAGEMVVSSGANLLSDGEKIQIVP